ARAAGRPARGRRHGRKRGRRVADPDRLWHSRHQLSLQHGVPILPQRGSRTGAMMSDYILIDGDKAIFIPSLGPSTVVVQPGTLKASGPATLNGKKLCVEGDEKSVSEQALSYFTPSYPIPGQGTLKIKSLKSDQTAQKTKSGDKLVLLV